MTFLTILCLIAWAFGSIWTQTLAIEKDGVEEGVTYITPMTSKERALASILMAIAWPYFLYLLNKDG